MWVVSRIFGLVVVTVSNSAVVSLLISVQLFQEDLEVNLTVQQFQCDEFKVRIFFNIVEAKEMKAALRTRYNLWNIFVVEQVCWKHSGQQ